MADPNGAPLDYAERWLIDGLRVLRPPFSALQVTADMTNAMIRLEQFRKQGIRVTPTHLLVWAAGQAFAQNRALHQLIAGTRRHRPARVDIGLSVAGDTFVAPVMVIEGADHKTVEQIASEIVRRAPEVREADRKMLSALRRFGWVVPFGFLRRAILRLLFMSGTFRRKGAGTFQVSTVAGDWALTSTFSTGGVLVGGQIWQRVVAVDGQPAVRPMMTLTLSSDHGVFDGRAALKFLSAVKTELEAS
jgi:pyruvate/2-oxoglutarate dehydrogenase complex dihydrolipoamide acyltransferase (E2) component